MRAFYAEPSRQRRRARRGLIRLSRRRGITTIHRDLILRLCFLAEVFMPGAAEVFVNPGFDGEPGRACWPYPAAAARALTVESARVDNGTS